MKKLLLMMALLPLMAMADKQIVDGIEWTYTVQDGQATVCNGENAAIPTSTAGDITIPSTLGGCPVTNIGGYAFYRCYSLTSVVIPDCVVTVGTQAFGDCQGLTVVAIPKDLTKIGDGAFSFCYCLTSFLVAAGNPTYCALNGLLCSKDGKTVVAGVNGDVTIPDGVTRIGEHAFWGCENLRSVVIPGSVTSIEHGAFAWCGCLKSLTVPNGLRSIGKAAFDECWYLASVAIPSSVTNIEAGAFSRCGDLTSFSVAADNSVYCAINGLLCSKDGKVALEGVNGGVTIPEGVTSVRAYAFDGRYDLTSVLIPKSVTNIGAWAFGHCSRLTTVTIPNGVTAIEPWSFFDCSGLTTVTIPDDVDVIWTQAFEGCGGLTSVTIPSGVTSIWHRAFYDCSGLTSVTISTGVKSIGKDAFGNCDSLRTVRVHGDGDIEIVKGLLFDSGVDVSKIVFLPLVTFDGNGGVPSAVSMSAADGAAVGELPTASRGNYRFLGWFTAKSGGTRVTAETVVTKDVTYYAHWRIETVPDFYVTAKIDIDTGLASYTASGLPPGMTYNKTTGRITGAAKTAGEYVVTFAMDGAETEELTLVVRAAPKVTVELLGANAHSDTNGCKVTGAGTYLPGAKVTLRATAASAKKATAKTAEQIATVFAGWYESDPRGGGDGDRGATALPISLSPSYAFTMPAEDVTLYAKFVAQTADVAAVSFALPEEMTNGVKAVSAGVDVSGCTSLPSVKVTGLPTGLKFTDKLVTTKVTEGTGKNKVTTLVTNALPNTIYGTPTKSGVYTVVATVTTAGKKTASCSQTVVVRKVGEHVVKVDVPDIAGSVPGNVTGMGVYAKDKKVTLKATANKGYVFAGWWLSGAGGAAGVRALPDGEPVSRLASLAFTMLSKDVEYVAAFITSDFDKSNIVARVNGMSFGEPPAGTRDACPYLETNVWAGVYLEWPIAASALSEPTVKVTGLPSGLKFAAKPVTSKIGNDKAAVTVTNVPANTIYGAPSAASKAGKPSVVKVTVTTAGKSSQTYQINATVDPLPKWARGTFAGGWERANDMSGGQVSLTVSTAGKVSGKALGDGVTYTLAAPYYSGVGIQAARPESAPYQETVTNFVADVSASWSYTVGSKTVKTNETVAVSIRDNGIGGYAGTGDWFEAYSVDWKVEPWKTLGKSFDKDTLTYVVKSDGTFSENDEEIGLSLGNVVVGCVTLKFSSNGSVAVSGEFVTGYDAKKSKFTTVKATGSAALVPENDNHVLVFVYLMPKGLSPHTRSLKVLLP